VTEIASAPNDDPKRVTVAIAQFAPVYLDKRASLAKAINLVQRAAKHGARLVAFGETWLPGYPAWLDVCPGAALWQNPSAKDVFARLRNNSITVPGEEVNLLSEAARDLKIAIVIGVNERVDFGPGSGTLYNSLLTISDDGHLKNHHRKLVPTYTERLVWGNGDGRGLEAAPLSVGRVGGLICWEHWMPLARMAMHNSGEHIHVAVWPTVHELHQLASRHYAFEGRCFVLAVGLLMHADDLPGEFRGNVTSQSGDSQWLECGGSAIIGPDSKYVLNPVYDREDLLISDLDLTQIDREMMAFDVSGHYARPDLFRFERKV
jgi:nitrilase